MIFNNSENWNQKRTPRSLFPFFASTLICFPCLLSFCFIFYCGTELRWRTRFNFGKNRKPSFKKNMPFILCIKQIDIEALERMEKSYFSNSNFVGNIRVEFKVCILQKELKIVLLDLVVKKEGILLIVLRVLRQKIFKFFHFM